MVGTVIPCKSGCYNKFVSQYNHYVPGDNFDTKLHKHNNGVFVWFCEWSVCSFLVATVEHWRDCTVYTKETLTSTWLLLEATREPIFTVKRTQQPINDISN